MPAHKFISKTGQDDVDAFVAEIKRLEKAGFEYVNHQYYMASPEAYYVIITTPKKAGAGKPKVERRTRSDKT